MNWLSALTAAALFAAACNLDTVLLSAGFAARGVVLRRGYGLVIAALTTLITWLSLALGARPIMAEHPREVEEITATAAALKPPACGGAWPWPPPWR